MFTKQWRHRSRPGKLVGLRRRLGRVPRGVAWFAGGATSGGIATFLGDPESGARRRALARDRTAGAIRRTARGWRGLRIAGAYTVGWGRRARHVREQPKELDDATLAQKVQTKIFREAGSPKGTVDVNVANGVVQLRGEVERPELIDDLVRKVRRIQGVQDVESFLHLPHTTTPA